MAARKAERLLKLHIMLLGRRHYVSKESIRRALYSDYPDTTSGTEAFEKAFERDKEDLRAIGSVIEVGSMDAYFDDEIGYRIPDEETSLPEVHLEADEAAVLSLAAKVWEQESLAKATSGALLKLQAQGTDLEPAGVDLVTPAIGADEPAFEPLWEAVLKRRVVTFDYQASPSSPQSKRRLQPWGLVRTSGRWYVVGHDLDRGAERVFRLTRVRGAIRAHGKSGAYEIPAGVDVRAVAESFQPREAPVTARVQLREGSGHGLRRRAESVTHDVRGPDARTRWDEATVTGRPYDLVSEILTYGANAVIVEPEDLRNSIIDRLQEFVAVTGDAS